jgi:WD40 repeat protein
VTAKEQRQIDSRMWLQRSMALSPDGKTVATGDVHSTVRLWDLASGRQLSQEAPGHDARVNSVAYSPDGKLLASGGDNKQVWIWNTASGTALRSFSGQSATAVAYCPDGRRLAFLTGPSVNFNKVIQVRDADSGNELFRLSHDAARNASAFAFAPDGKTLVSAEWSGGGILNEWDAATGRRLRRLGWSEPYARGLAYDPDGTTLALFGGMSNQDLIRLWDVRRGKEIRAFGRHLPVGYVAAAAFSPDGRLLASGGSDRNVRLWEGATGEQIFCFAGHSHAVAAVAFSPDGRFVASGSGADEPRNQHEGADKIRLWDVVTGREMKPLDVQGSHVTSLAFSSDGSQLASGLQNGTVLLWQAPMVSHGQQKGPLLEPGSVEALWSDLAGRDARAAYVAIRHLAAAGAQAVEHIRGRLQPTAEVDPTSIRHWIAELASERFAVREAATAELENVLDQAEPVLREALAKTTDQEARRRLEGLLRGLPAGRSPDALRRYRGIQVLEYIGSPDARRVLKRFAEGAPLARQTQEARASLSRLARRTRTMP